MTEMFIRPFKLGRRRPVARCPRLKLSNYTLKTLPTPPAAISYQHLAKKAMGEIYLNDTLGDCVIAGMAHMEGVISGNAGDEALFSPEEIIELYGAIGGYVPGDPSTDNGCDEQTALNYWQETGMFGRKITGWIAVNAMDLLEVRTALWLFENLMFGIELPDAWVTPFPTSSGFIWDVAGASDPNNGHCVVGIGYDSTTVRISTWGMVGLMTNAAVMEYASQPNGGGELYAVITPGMINKATAKAPNGFDWSQLIADFDSMA